MAKSTNKKKSEGIYQVECIPNLGDLTHKTKKKPWKDITSMDLYYLFLDKWKTGEVSAYFGVSSLDVVSKLRKS